MPIEVDDEAIEAADHIVLFYERDDDHVQAVTRYLLDGFSAGEVGLTIATAEHQGAFELALTAAGEDVTGLRRRGDWVALDAAAALALFTIDGSIDRGRFRCVVGGAMKKAAQAQRPVRAYGEMVALLWAAGDFSAALELEELWNELRHEMPFSLLCGYASQAVSRAEGIDGWGEVCRVHSSAERQFGARREAPALARGFVSDAVRAQGHGRDMGDNAALVAGELTTNAILHAGSPFTVAVSSPDGVLRISVHDVNPMLPVPRRKEPLAESGRGLGLVAALAEGWGAAVDR